jgi:hypothetical protein
MYVLKQLYGLLHRAFIYFYKGELTGVKKTILFAYRFSGYPASMLSSAALAAAATALATAPDPHTDQLIANQDHVAGKQHQLTGQKQSSSRLNSNNLVSRLQILTRVENVS